MDNDGVPDLFASSAPSSGNGSVSTLSGKTKKVLGTRFGAKPEYGRSVAGVDTNADDVVSLVVGQPTATGGIALTYDRRPVANPPTWKRYGSTCFGSGGRLPRIYGSSRTSGPADFFRGAMSRTGSQYRIMLRSGPPSSVSVLMIGPMPRLDFPLDLLGMNGCSLLAGPSIMIHGSTDGNGASSLTLPAQTLNPGSQIVFQWFLLDPGANSANLTLSDAAELRVGPRL